MARAHVLTAHWGSFLSTDNSLSYDGLSIALRCVQNLPQGKFLDPRRKECRQMEGLFLWDFQILMDQTCLALQKYSCPYV
ncbi:hypothetical protein LguiB_003449 [Lonicera macranthoides]